MIACERLVVNGGGGDVEDCHGESLSGVVMGLS